MSHHPNFSQFQISINSNTYLVDDDFGLIGEKVKGDCIYNICLDWQKFSTQYIIFNFYLHHRSYSCQLYFDNLVNQKEWSLSSIDSHIGSRLFEDKKTRTPFIVIQICIHALRILDKIFWILLVWQRSNHIER